MTPTPRTYRTGFEQVFDCPAGRRILAQLQARHATPAASQNAPRRHPPTTQPAK